MRLFISARFTDEAIDFLRPHFGEIRLGGFRKYGFRESGTKMPEEELLRETKGCEVVIVEYDPVSERVLSQPGLRLLACCRNEPEANVDIQAATRYGIPVLYPHGRNAVTVAEFAFGLMLAIARNIARVDYLIKYSDELTSDVPLPGTSSDRAVTSEWSLAQGAPMWRFSGPELCGKTLGLVGFGVIGQAVARLAQGFKMKLIVYDPYVAPERVAALGGRQVDKRELFSTADFVSVHCKVTPETKGLISADEFNVMKPTAYFINTARAVIVDTQALVEALQSGKIAGAAIDVYDREPIEPDNPLRQLPNVVLTSHLAASSCDIPIRHSMMIAEDIDRVLRGERPVSVANPEVLGRVLR